jgi:HK97 family phage prohead protease
MKTQLNKKINKLFNISLKSINDEERTVQFVFSDDSVDRYGEKVDQKTWDVTHYKNNPVVLWGHDPSEPQNILGRAVDIQLDQSGKSLLTAQFDTAEVNPKADLIYRQVKAGTLRTVSAGFIPHTMEFEDDVPVLKDNELLEVSVVAIPANRNALALSYKVFNGRAEPRHLAAADLPLLVVVRTAAICGGMAAVALLLPEAVHLIAARAAVGEALEQVLPEGTALRVVAGAHEDRRLEALPRLRIDDRLPLRCVLLHSVVVANPCVPRADGDVAHLQGVPSFAVLCLHLAGI